MKNINTIVGKWIHMLIIFFMCLWCKEQQVTSKDCFIAKNRDINLLEWCGWKVCQHPDHYYYVVEYKSYPKFFYSTKEKKGRIKYKYKGQYIVEYITDGHCSLQFMEEYPLINPDDLIKKMNWIQENALSYIRFDRDSSSLLIQSRHHFALSCQMIEGKIEWNDWQGTFW